MVFPVLVAVIALVLVVVLAFPFTVRVDFAFHGPRRVGRLHDNRGQVVPDGVDRAIHPRLESDPVHHDHVRLAKRQQVGRGGFEAVRLDPRPDQHVDLGPVTADTLGEVAQRIDRGDNLEAVGRAVAFTAGGGKDQRSKNGDDHDAEFH